MKVCWVTLASCILLLAVLISALKYTLPYLDDYRVDIEQYVLNNFGAQVAIGEIGASWQTSGPVINLYNLVLEPSAQAPLDISIDKTQLKVNFWQSLFEQRFVSESFVLEGVNAKINSEVFYQVRPNSDGSQLLDNLSHLFLSQLQTFKLVNSDIEVRHKNNKTQSYHLESLTWLNANNKHQASGNLYVDGFSNNSISFIADLYGNKREHIFGQVYFEASQMDVSPWLMQLIDEHVDLASTQANFKAWGEIKNGLVEDILLDVYDTGLNWSLGKKNKYLGIKKTRLHWWKSDSAWVAFANDIKLHTETEQFDDFYLTLFSDLEHSSLDVGDANIETLSQLFSLFSATKSLDFLTLGTLSGKVDNLQLLWQQGQELAANVHLSDVDFLPHLAANQAYLGVKNVDVNGFWLGTQGRLQLTGNDGQLVTRDTFSDPIDYQQLELVSYFDTGAQVPSITIPKLHLKNDEVDINLAAQYTLADTDILSLYAEVKGPKQGSIHQYLPKHLLDDELYQYLTDGIQQGRGEHTQVVIYGAPSELLDEQQAQLLVRAQLRDGIFNFDPDWPQVEELDAELWVRSDNMTIYGQSAKFYGIDINNDLSVDIPLSSGDNKIQVMFSPEQIQFSRFHDLVEHSPLKQELGEIFEFVKLDGEAAATINVAVPKYEHQEVVAQGTVVTFASNLDLPELKLSFTELETVVNFRNEKIEIDTSAGKLFGLPVSFHVSGSQQAKGYQLNANLDAKWQHEQISQLYRNKLNSYFSGELTTELLLQLNLTDDGYQYFVDAKTDITDASYQVDQHLAKPLEQIGFVDIAVIGDETGNELEVNFDNNAYFSAYLGNASGVFERTLLSIGTDEAALPESGFDIHLALNQLEFEPTLTFVTDLITTVEQYAPADSATSSDSEPVLDVPQHVYGNVQQLSILGQTWQGVSLDAKPEAQSWLFSLGAKQTLTDVRVYHDLEQKGIDINSTFLQIELEENEAADAVSEAFTNSDQLIASLPPIQFVCERCSYNSKPLGRLELAAYAKGTDLIVDKASLRYKRNQADFKGVWFGNAGAGKTELSGKVYSRYFGDWVKEYGLNTGIKDSPGDIELDISWKNAPFAFDFESLNGTAKFNLGEGYLSEVSDKGARLLSLLSLDSLYRKLKFDFNDVFEKGLFYNDITGDIVVKNGVGYSDNIRMDGVAGNMEMKGFTDLNTNSLDYNVTFTPKYTSSFGVLTWIAASNPIAIIGAFALDKIIEQADVVAELRMKVSGDLANPKVEDVKRFNKKVQMPSKEEIEQFRKNHALPLNVQVKSEE